MTDELRILLVEDNEADAELFREAIGEAGLIRLALTHEKTLAEALDRLEHGDFRVVVVDLGLPDSRGLDAIQEIARAAPRVPVIVLTGTADEELALRTLQQGAQDYLIKDEVSGATITRAVRYAVERQGAADLRADIRMGLRHILKPPLAALFEALRVAGTASADELTERQREMFQRIRVLGASLERLVEAETVAATVRTRPRLQVLLVEDNPGDACLIEEELASCREPAIELTHTPSLTDASSRVRKQHFDAAFIDLGLPDAAGLEAVSDIAGVAPHLPIVVLTGLDDDEKALEALRIGAQDYLIKGEVDGYALVRSLRFAIERQAALNVPAELVGAVARDLQNPVHNILGYAHLLLETVPDPLGEEQVEALHHLLEPIAELQRLAHGMNEVAKGEWRGARERTMLGDVGPLFAELKRRVSQSRLVAEELAGSLGPRRLPGGKPEAVRPSILSRMMKRVAPRRKSILVVDRDDDSRTIARTALESANFQVIEAADGMDGFTQLSEGAVDLAVVEGLSSSIPNARGVETVEQAAAVCGIPAVLVSEPGGCDGLGVGRGGATGMFIPKPFTPEQLVFMVDRALSSVGRQRAH